MELEAEKDLDTKNRLLAHQQAQRLKFLAGRLGMQGENAFEQYRATMESLFGLYRLVNDTGTNEVWKSRKLWNNVWSDIREVVNTAVCPGRTSRLVKRVLVTVKGGVADYVAEDGVDVELIDYDNEPTAEIPREFLYLVALDSNGKCPRRFEVVHTNNGGSFEVEGNSFGEACMNALARLGWSMAPATTPLETDAETVLAWQ